MVILRPLLVFFNFEQILLINKITMWILAIILLVILFKNSKTLAVAYIISMVILAFPIVQMCLEYTWTFYIMLIASILSILIVKKEDKHFFTLIFITGMLTCYFDFLTTEIITLFVPLVFVLYIRKKEEGMSSFKEVFLLLIKETVLWGIAYIGMWLAKCLLTSFIFHVNVIQYVKDNAMLRINGLQGLTSYQEMYWGAIFKNLHNLYPINIVKKNSHLIIGDVVFIAIILVSFD